MFTIKRRQEPENLIITATIAGSRLYPEVSNWSRDIESIVNDVVSCYEAGASVAHIHMPQGEETEIIKRIREQCDIIIQAGTSSVSFDSRVSCFNSRPEMMTVNLNHHAIYFHEETVDALHSLTELEDYCFKCKEVNIKPEWEIWHCGSYWNLNYLIEKGILDWEKPHILTLFFNWPGGNWSPPTYDEYMHRKNYMPDDCVHSVSAMGEEQMRLLVFVLTHGGHIRVGTEDYPFIEKGKPAENNAEIVDQYADISRHVGRAVADPSEARKILGL